MPIKPVRFARAVIRKRRTPMRLTLTTKNARPFVKRAMRTKNPAVTLLKYGLTQEVLFQKYRIGVREMKRFGLNVNGFVMLGANGKQIRLAGFETREIVAAHVPPKILLEAEGPAWVLESDGFTARILAKKGYTPEELKSLGFK